LSLKAFGERLEEIWSRLEIMVEQMAKPEYNVKKKRVLQEWKNYKKKVIKFLYCKQEKK
jgi:hypothetical protein